MMERKTCMKCKHQWTPRTVSEPRQCPSCHRWDWKEPGERLLSQFCTCHQCGKEWMSKPQGENEKPKHCPKCRSQYWDDENYIVKQKNIFTCLRCPPTGRMVAGEVERRWWMSRLDHPRVCPNCHSPYWDRQRIRPVKAGKGKK